jgi:choline-glycine betaine transporter
MFEKYLPWLMGAAGAVIPVAIPYLRLLNASWRDDFLNKIISVCAIFVAYLVTVVTILPVIEEKSIIQRLKRWGYFQYIVSYLRDAIWSSAILLVLCLAVSPFPKSLASIDRFDLSYSAAWWAALFFAAGSVYRATHLLLKMLLAH